MEGQEAFSGILLFCITIMNSLDKRRVKLAEEQAANKVAEIARLEAKLSLLKGG